MYSVHPRRCGEHGIGTWPFMFFYGSSPQVRGTLFRPMRQNIITRFIPAGAGNTTSPNQEQEQEQVHPRRCGEHGALRRTEIKVSGSSPQVRGTRCRCGLSKASSWFIPAGAGNTQRQYGFVRLLTVHPRRCGEHLSAKGALGKRAGSSPQVRGTQPMPCASRATERFIPAGAGNTADEFDYIGAEAVHPRRCGEHWHG